MRYRMTLTLIAFSLAVITGKAYADVVGGVSHLDAGGVRVGTSVYPDRNRAGVAVDGQLRSTLVAATHFANDRYLKDTGVYHYSGRELVAAGDAPGAGSRRDHSKLGVWSFAQVGSEDVWFGEWSAESPSGDMRSKQPGTHTVWYVGENNDVASTLPTDAPVNYTVRSINSYGGAAPPTSTLTANFATGAAKSSGDIGFSMGSIKTVGNDVRLAAADVNVASSGGTGGNLEGKFFGTGASSVAGIVTFSNRDQDTAFGGSRNPS